MKKKLALLFAVMMVFSAFSGCGKKDETTEESTPEIQTEFHLEKCGLSYTIPEEWTEMNNCNLLPSSFVNTNGEIYAKIQYQYAPDASMEALGDAESTIPIEELMTPVMELLVVKEEHLASDAVKAELALFQNQEELPTQKNFHFYYLTGYADGIDHFDENAQNVYRELESYLPAFRDSIKTFLPDEAAANAAAEENSKYISFMTTTLEGDPIVSSVFAEYDMTVINFWGSYCYPDINELDTLQEFYKDLQKKHPNVNFFQVVTDTPNAQAEEIVAKAYKEAGATFPCVMTDKYLANWIVNNLEGLPTTIFVDQTGMPFSLKIEGIQDASYYMETTEAMLQRADTAE